MLFCVPLLANRFPACCEDKPTALLRPTHQAAGGVRQYIITLQIRIGRPRTSLRRHPSCRPRTRSRTLRPSVVRRAGDCLSVLRRSPPRPTCRRRRLPTYRRRHRLTQRASTSGRRSERCRACLARNCMVWTGELSNPNCATLLVSPQCQWRKAVTSRQSAGCCATMRLQPH